MAASKIRGYWVYLARCRDESLYSGSTTDVARRMKEHNTGAGAKYTASRLPVHLVAAWEVSSWSEALRLEAFLKKRVHQVKEQLAACPGKLAPLVAQAGLELLILKCWEDKEMPIVQIEMFEGRTLEQKQKMVEKVTEAIVETVGAKPEQVSIIIREMSRENYSRGGQLESEKK